MKPLEAFIKYAEMCGIEYHSDGYLTRRKRVDSPQRLVDVNPPQKIASTGRYKRVGFKWDGVRYTVYEHRAIMALVVGLEKVNKYESIDHVNGDSSDNRIENLELVSAKENYRRACEDQFLLTYGEDNHASVLSVGEVEEMRSLYMNSNLRVTSKTLSEYFGISHSAANSVVGMRTWFTEGVPEGYLEFLRSEEEFKKSPSYPKKRVTKGLCPNLSKAEYYLEGLKGIREYYHNKGEAS